ARHEQQRLAPAQPAERLFPEVGWYVRGREHAEAERRRLGLSDIAAHQRAYLVRRRGGFRSFGGLTAGREQQESGEAGGALGREGLEHEGANAPRAPSVRRQCRCAVVTRAQPCYGRLTEKERRYAAIRDRAGHARRRRAGRGRTEGGLARLVQ